LAAEPSHLTLASGECAEIQLTLTIPAGWHIPPRRPETAGQMATICSLETILPAELGPIVYPIPVHVNDIADTADADALGYTGTITLVVPVQINDDARSGDFALMASIRTQPCTDRECLAPIVISKAITIRIG
jgi:DsbC/DsbD-like thiol-disulfide interchange protein